MNSLRQCDEMKTSNAPEPLPSGSGIFSADRVRHRPIGPWRGSHQSQVDIIFLVTDHRPCHPAMAKAHHSHAQGEHDLLSSLLLRLALLPAAATGPLSSVLVPLVLTAIVQHAANNGRDDH